MLHEQLSVSFTSADKLCGTMIVYFDAQKPDSNWKSAHRP